MEEIIVQPEASCDGKRNAYHHRCNVVGHCRSYAVCLHLCEERKKGRLKEVYSECSAAIGKKTCPALAMRREEKEKGKAIYFIERMIITGESFFNKAKELLGVSEKAPAKLKPLHKSSLNDIIDAGGYTDAINSALNKAVAKPATYVAKPATVVAKQGESMIELARRMMKERI